MKKTILLTSIAALAIMTFLFYNGYLLFNHPDSRKYQVKGIDFSNHQGEIDWEKVKEQGYGFAYIKATEGMDYKDAYFQDNWQNAKTAGIPRGAYHFFTFGSTGMDQAKNFITTVPSETGTLPVVIDVEFGGNSKHTCQRQIQKRTN